jgi:hypothetical protein
VVRFHSYSFKLLPNVLQQKRMAFPIGPSPLQQAIHAVRLEAGIQATLNPGLALQHGMSASSLVWALTVQRSEKMPRRLLSEREAPKHANLLCVQVREC